jgi:hypothetical protein
MLFPNLVGSSGARWQRVRIPARVISPRFVAPSPCLVKARCPPKPSRWESYSQGGPLNDGPAGGVSHTERYHSAMRTDLRFWSRPVRKLSCHSIQNRAEGKGVRGYLCASWLCFLSRRCHSVRVLALNPPRHPSLQQLRPLRMVRHRFPRRSLHSQKSQWRLQPRLRARRLWTD